jgi:putative transposase
MPRQARIDAPGALHHIICRGIERRRIFLDDEDRNKFVARLGDALLKTSTRCFAWALIPNHFHLLLSTGTLPIASVMERVLTGYAGDFNRRHKRHGHLFQNRYKSILCQSELYLLELVRYITLNPLRAGMVSSIDELESYPYTGHSGLLSGKAPAWQSTDEVLARFNKTSAAGHRTYQGFLAEGVGMGKRADLIGGGLIRSAGGWEQVSLARHFGEHLKSDERILGNSDFVQEVLGCAQEEMEKTSFLHSQGVDLDQVTRRVAEVLQIDSSEIWKEGKKAATVRARSLLCYWAIKELGMTAVAVAKRVRLSEPTVLRAAERGKQLADVNGWNLV